MAAAGSPWIAAAVPRARPAAAAESRAAAAARAALRRRAPRSARPAGRRPMAAATCSAAVRARTGRRAAAAAIAFRCGSPTCVGATCSSLGYTCGLAGDGCGNHARLRHVPQRDDVRRRWHARAVRQAGMHAAHAVSERNELRRLPRRLRSHDPLRRLHDGASVRGRRRAERVRDVDVLAEDLRDPEADVRTDLRRVRRYPGLRQHVQPDAALLEQPMHHADLHADDLLDRGRVLRQYRRRVRQPSDADRVSDGPSCGGAGTPGAVRLREVHAGDLRQPEARSVARSRMGVAAYGRTVASAGPTE